MNIYRRQNVDRLRSSGIEFEGTWRLPPPLFFALTGAVVNAAFDGDARLAGYRAPLVPVYNVGFNVRYDNGAWVVSGQLRVTGPRFEDDVNTLKLGRGNVVDLLTSRAIARKVNAFVAVTNVFDAANDVGRIPARLVGPPRTVRGGVQVAVN